MAEAYDSEEQQRYQSYLKIHLKSEQQELSLSDKIEALEKKDRSKWWHLVINFAAILFFAYSFYFDITQLGQTLFIIIFIVFGINVGLIIYQKKQINELIEYLQWKKQHEHTS